MDAKPLPAQGLAANGIGGNAVRFNWLMPAVPPDTWRISWRREGQRRWINKVVNRGEIETVGGRHEFTVRDLAPYAHHDIAVRAVLGGVDSDPAEITVLTTKRDDDAFGPADPSNAVAETVKSTSATISWDQDDPRAVKAWYVGVVGHTPLKKVTAQEHTIVDLQPDTAYTALVYVKGFDESYIPNPVTIDFATRSGEPSPYPNQPSGLRVVRTDPSTGNAVVEWDDADDCHFWKVLLESETRWRTARDHRYVFKGLDAIVTREWRVKAVREDADGWEFESGPARGPEIRFDSAPQPEPSTGMHFHCTDDEDATG